MEKLIAKIIGLSILLLAIVCCSDDGVSSDDVRTEESEASSTDSLERCEMDGAFTWDKAGESFFRCEDGVMRPHKVEHQPTGFDACKFNFGAGWQHEHEDSAFYAGLDYIVVWLGDNAFFNAFEQRMINRCLQIDATPMIYGYVIAEFGKDHDLVDCDVASSVHPNTLCTDGAELIRTYFADSILFRYDKYASGIKKHLERIKVDPKTFKSIWLIEPDFYQYSESGSKQRELKYKVGQKGGGVPDAEMGKYFKQIVDTIRFYLPSAEIAMDISPWISDWKEYSQKQWYSNFDLSIVDYVSTSGGRTLAGDSLIRPENNATWKEIYDVVKKPILADAGYGVAGSSTGHDKRWNQAVNIEKRMADGVVGIMQMNSSRDYGALADTIRPQLNYKYPWCKK